eukprot:TRINITY_DN16072_c0_g1::TRINITY_DN16072_c0_g1_i1::g.13744::m.13744 TRINITY_DN16072_c0_g1::TRINITY_DN16072_c0_g1_i1::g.13744  ORF type:complete len:250 (+),score=31.13,sp/Q9D273/MMAB_MOUSE/51.32/1e-56,Cob_adeno_trans/PF01923.13/1.1e-52 TRINITY_DN16072_c0_g1_i1:36-752(+)
MLRRCIPLVFSQVRCLNQARTIASTASVYDNTRLKIYTRTGDKGTSSLFNGERRPKDDMVFEALGTIDETSAFLGQAIEFCAASTNMPADRQSNIIEQFRQIQSRLLDAGAHVATPLTNASDSRKERTQFSADHATLLEQWIDEMDASLPELKTFILPGGSITSSFLHAARVVCRRAERRCAPLLAQGDIDPAVYRYLNRLSDYLFTAARYACMLEGKPEAKYYLDPKKRAAVGAASL